MTLDQAAKIYQWSKIHDYKDATIEDGKIVAIEGLGLWEGDLLYLEEKIPGLITTTRSRVDHGANGVWLRVDLRLASDTSP